MTMKWGEYVFANGRDTDAGELLQAATPADSRSLYVLGVGFDPRCLVGLAQFLALEHQHEPAILRVGMPSASPGTQSEVSEMAATHLERFEELTDGMDVRTLDYPQVENSYSAGPVMAREITDVKHLADVGHIAIDISSLPSTLYFPILKAALLASDRDPKAAGHFSGEIQVVACENAAIDGHINDLAVSGASYVGGFRPKGAGDTDHGGTRVWVPVIGENSEPALRAIHGLLEPDDVCPVLPFPAVDPRRADALVIEHRKVLFDAFRVTASDFVYADERNPFDLYRALCNLERDYRAALEPLAPTMVALSAHGSKLLSLGVLLAAYERELPIVAAAVEDYEIMDGATLGEFSDSNQLCCLWLAGAPFK